MAGEEVPQAGNTSDITKSEIFRPRLGFPLSGDNGKDTQQQKQLKSCFGVEGKTKCCLQGKVAPCEETPSATPSSTPSSTRARVWTAVVFLSVVVLAWMTQLQQGSLTGSASPAHGQNASSPFTDNLRQGSLAGSASPAHGHNASSQFTDKLLHAELSIYQALDLTPANRTALVQSPGAAHIYNAAKVISSHIDVCRVQNRARVPANMWGAVQIRFMIGNIPNVPWEVVRNLNTLAADRWDNPHSGTIYINDIVQEGLALIVKDEPAVTGVIRIPPIWLPLLQARGAQIVANYAGVDVLDPRVINAWSGKGLIDNRVTPPPSPPADPPSGASADTLSGSRTDFADLEASFADRKAAAVAMVGTTFNILCDTTKKVGTTVGLLLSLLPPNMAHKWM